MSKSFSPQGQQLPNQKYDTAINSLKSQMEDPIRLAGNSVDNITLAIRGALKNLKQRNEKYIEHMQLNSKWRKIYNSLLGFNQQQQLPKLIKLQLCQVSGIAYLTFKGRQKSFYDPFSNTPISICYNKINKFALFEQQTLFNLILHYDNKTNPSTNWNSLEPTVKSVVRALHISGMCQKEDKACFEEQVKWRVLEKERFKGMKVDFDEVWKKGLEDYTPISNVTTAN